MAVQKNKVSRSKRNKRRSHHALANPVLSEDPVSGDVHLRHHVSRGGFYKGSQVVDVKDKLS